MAINKTSFSSVDFVGERHWEGSTPRSPRAASFGGVERIRSSSFDGFHSKNFTDATLKYPEWNASSLGINRIGKLAILAAKRGFMVIDFDYPNKPKKYLCNFKWEPGSLEWNPHHANDDLFASVMNQKIDIWDINTLQNSSHPQSTLSGHTRAISNMNWNYFDPNSLLTCSMDTYINLWDIRKNKRPASTFTTVAGSSQVKWNRKNNHLFGSAHDGDIRIWDIRKGNVPLVYIAGHLARIHAFDWCPHKEEFFVTASQDSTVKVWNMKTPKQSWASINNGAPVWKAKYTPFGNGLVTILVPQLRRTENSMFLWNMSDFKTPVNKFVGHEDVVLEFHWRTQRKDEHEEYQLVSWSKDQSLRLWRASKKNIQSITGEPYTRLSEEAMDGSLLSIDNSHFEDKKKTKKHVNSPDSPPMMSSTYKDPSTFKENINNQMETENKPLGRPEKLDLVGLNLMDTKPYVQSPLSPGRLMSPMSRGRGFHGNNASFSPDGGEGAHGYMTPTQVLHQEFTLLNVNSPYFKVEKKDSEARLCVIAVRTQYIFFKLHVTFPMKYPDKDPPVFQFSKDSQIGDGSKQNIVNALREISTSHVNRNRPCLEACLRRLRYVIENIEETTSQLSGDSPSVLQRTGSYDYKNGEVGHDMTDSTVPFPRTCGARFCSVGDKLVVFSRPEKYNNIFVAERSLRSMSALNAYLQTNSNDVFDNSGENQLGTLRKKPKAIGLVYISNTSLLIPVSKELAQNYALHGDDPSALCLRNAELADKVMRKDLVQTWTLLSKILSKEVGPDSSSSFEKVPWACHPFGRRMINSLFDYYERLKDVQTLAIMSCLLDKQHLPEDIQELSKITKIVDVEEDKPPTRPSTRFSNPDSFQVSPEFSPYDVYNRSSVGQDDSPLNFAPEEKSYDPEEELRKQHSENCRLLNPKETFRYDQFKRNYSEILYRWDMQAQRTEVMKFCTEQHEEKRIMDIVLDCNSCNTQRNNPCCAKCKSFIVKCSVCRIGVRGLLSFCMTCGHGGHMYHLIDWFKQNDWCATGCGCYCLRSGLASAPYNT